MSVRSTLFVTEVTIDQHQPHFHSPKTIWEKSAIDLHSAQLEQLCLAPLFIMLSLSCSIVTLMIDQIAGIDYSLVGAPQVTSQGLDTHFKVRGCRERALEPGAGRKPILPLRVGFSSPPDHLLVSPCP